MLETFGGTSVLDCCQGSAEIWRRLLCAFPNIKYFGMDIEPARGRPPINSVDYLVDGNISGYDIFDIDTFGSPWEHWIALTSNRNLHGEITVFLTYGVNNAAMAGRMEKAIKRVLNINFPVNLPLALLNRVRGEMTNDMIACCRDHGWDISYLVEVVPDKKSCARYFGVRITRNKL